MDTHKSRDKSLKVCSHHDRYSSLSVPCKAKAQTSFNHSVICMVFFVSFTVATLLLHGWITVPTLSLTIESFATPGHLPD